MQLCLKRRNFAQYFNKQSLGFVLSAQSYCGGESLVGMLSAVGKQVLWRRIMADETWEAQVFGKNKKGKYLKSATIIQYTIKGRFMSR